MEKLRFLLLSGGMAVSKGAVAQVGPGHGAAKAPPVPGMLLPLGMGWAGAPRTGNWLTFPCKGKVFPLPLLCPAFSDWQEEAEQMAPLLGFTRGVPRAISALAARTP